MMYRIESADLKRLGATEKALWVYANTNPCTITWDTTVDYYIVDIAGDRRYCESPEAMIAFLESYDLREAEEA